MDTPLMAANHTVQRQFCSKKLGLLLGPDLSIAQNTALFSLLGTTFGGNGQTTFALPDSAWPFSFFGTGQGPWFAQH